MAQQKRRQSSDTSDPSVGQSFQDQLKSKLEARKRSLEGGDTSTTNHVNNVSVQPPTQPSLPLTEVQPVSYKGNNIVKIYIFVCDLNSCIRLVIVFIISVRKPTPPVHSQVLVQQSSPSSQSYTSSSSPDKSSPPHKSSHHSHPQQQATINNPYIQTAGKVGNNQYLHGHSHFVGKFRFMRFYHNSLLKMFYQSSCFQEDLIC